MDEDSLESPTANSYCLIDTGERETAHKRGRSSPIGRRRIPKDGNGEKKDNQEELQRSLQIVNEYYSVQEKVKMKKQVKYRTTMTEQ